MHEHRSPMTGTPRLLSETPDLLVALIEALERLIVRPKWDFRSLNEEMGLLPSDFRLQTSGCFLSANACAADDAAGDVNQCGVRRELAHTRETLLAFDVGPLHDT